MKYFFFVILYFFKKYLSLPTEEYSMQYIISIRVKNKQDLNFLLDTSKSYSVFFSNTNKIGYNNLPDNYFSDFITSIEINTFNIKNFVFKIENDNTNFNNRNIQGIIGLGINENSNSLLDKMKEEKIIKKRIIFFLNKPSPKIYFQNEISKRINEKYLGCYINSQSNKLIIMNKNYSESWNCDLNYIYIENKEKYNKNIFNNGSKIENYISINDTIKVNSKVIFDAKSYYITTSVKYLDIILNEFNSTKKCSPFYFDNYYFISCNINEEKLKNIPFICFILDGYCFKIKGENLFIKNKRDIYYSLIRFSNNSEYDNIFILGYPFFSSYKIKFDYDNNFIGFLGDEEPINFKKILKEFNIKFDIVKFVGISGIIIVSIILFIFCIKNCIMNDKSKSHIKFIDEVNY